MIKIHNKQEQGRSMTEMLGVLAIIGVLSIGGIAGYTYAMNKYYTNELLSGASARAVVLASQIASGRQLSLSEFEDTTTPGGDFGAAIEFSDGVGIQVSGVKKEVCENLLKSIADTDITLAKDDTGAELTECAETNSFYITFDNMGGGSVVEEDGQTCESGIVKVYDCETKELTDCCPDNGNTCAQPSCSCDSNDDCPSPQECDGDGVCACPWNSSGVPGEFKNGVCCDSTLAWDAHNWVYRLLNIEACGCPNGGVQSKTVSGVCCKDGAAWVNDYHGYAAVNIEACGGCPRSSEEKKGVCCNNNNFAWIHDEYDGYDRYGFNGVIPEVCGCPYDGDLKNGVCCKDGRAWDNDFWGYDPINIEACGCPLDWDGNSGTAIEGVCCLNGKAWNFGDGDYTDVNSACSPCPGDDWYLSSGVCCNGWGLAWDGDDYTQMNISACGCPFDTDANPGTESSDGKTCCFEGKAWNGSEFLYNLDSASCS